MGALGLSILGIRANKMEGVRAFDAWAVGVWRKKDEERFARGRATVFITRRAPPGDQSKTKEPVTSV